LKQDKLIKFTPPELDENATNTQQEMWRFHAKNTNLESFYAIVLSDCDPILEDQVYKREEYEYIDTSTLGRTR